MKVKNFIRSDQNVLSKLCLKGLANDELLWLCFLPYTNVVIVSVDDVKDL